MPPQASRGMRAPRRGDVRTTYDENGDRECSVEVYDGTDWRWVGQIRRVKRSPNGVLFSSSDDSLELRFRDLWEALEVLASRGRAGQL